MPPENRNQLSANDLLSVGGVKAPKRREKTYENDTDRPLVEYKEVCAIIHGYKNAPKPIVEKLILIPKF
jgi:hypothetical protein